MNSQSRKPSAKVERPTLLKNSQSEIIKLTSLSKKLSLQIQESKNAKSKEKFPIEKSKESSTSTNKPFHPSLIMAALSRSKERVLTPKKSGPLLNKRVNQVENLKKPDELKRTIITKEEILANLKLVAREKNKRKALNDSKENKTYITGYLTNSSEFEDRDSHFMDAKSSKAGTASGSTSMQSNKRMISGKDGSTLSTESVLFSDDLFCSDNHVDDTSKEFEVDEGFEIDMIHIMISKENSYLPDPCYFQKKQNQINWTMRAILVDWMMEVSTEFTMKRETFHIAVNYVDRYLSKISITKMQLQLIGVTSLYMAAKMEEIYPPRITDFAKSTDNGYSPSSIQDMELSMLKALNFYLAPSSYSTWISWFTSQWDVFIDQCPEIPFHIKTREEVQFRSPNENSYKLFRDLYQLIDVCLLDVKTLQYKPRLLIASMMYLIIGKRLKQFSDQEIIRNFVSCSFVDVDIQIPYNEFYYSYLLPAFGFNLMDLIPYIQFCSTFFVLPIEYDLPKAAKLNKEAVLDGHYEEFLAFQTHNPNNLEVVKNRAKKFA